MKDIKDALARVGEHLAEIAQVVVKAMDKLTPEQRAVIEFLAENPEVAEGLQELNQKLARQRAIEGATKETAQPKEPLIIDEAAAELVRAWAKHWGIEEIRAAIGAGTVELDGWSKSSRRWQEIEILGESMSIEVEENKAYTIDELCGEETPEPLEPSFIDLDERIREKEDRVRTFIGGNRQ